MILNLKWQPLNFHGTQALNDDNNDKKYCLLFQSLSTLEEKVNKNMSKFTWI